jgi:predicted component of type VI protein secretion system
MGRPRMSDNPFLEPNDDWNVVFPDPFPVGEPVADKPLPPAGSPGPLQSAAAPLVLGVFSPEQPRYGTYCVKLDGRASFLEMTFYIVVSAAMPEAELRELFPTLTTIGSPASISGLRDNAIPGIRIRPITVAPELRSLLPAAVYFELDSESDFWGPILFHERALGIHLAEILPAHWLQVWAVGADQNPFRAPGDPNLDWRPSSYEVAMGPIPIDLRRAYFETWFGRMSDRSMLVDTTYYLMVRADVPLATLRSEFPSRVVIGAVERLQDLIDVSSRGIELIAIDPGIPPFLPRQIPILPDVAYFKLNRFVPVWLSLLESAGFGIRVAGEYPNLAMRLWAVRS